MFQTALKVAKEIRTRTGIGRGATSARTHHQRAHRRHAAERTGEICASSGGILITTPESLYLLLTSQASEALRTVDTVIVDEIHALVPTKRGAHLALSLERLEALTQAAAAADRAVGHAEAVGRGGAVSGRRRKSREQGIREQGSEKQGSSRDRDEGSSGEDGCRGLQLIRVQPCSP